jgi:hypothetical protein
MAVDQGGDLVEGFEVFQDDLADARALDLDGDRPAVAQPRLVDLPQGGRGHGRGVEVRKGLGDAHAQLGGDDLLDLAVGERLDAVLEPGEGVQIGPGQEVGAGREELPELDEGRPQRLQVAGQLLGISGDGLVARFRVRQLDVDGFDDVRAAVLHQQARDVPISLEVLRLERDHVPFLVLILGSKSESRYNSPCYLAG